MCSGESLATELNVFVRFELGRMQQPSLVWLSLHTTSSIPYHYATFPYQPRHPTNCEKDAEASLK